MGTNIVEMTDGAGNIQYPKTNSDAVGMMDGSGNLTTYLNKRITELNISNLYPTQGIGGSNKYDLETAIAQVPAEYRTIVGLKITFINNAISKTETWKYNGGTFTTTTNWIQVDGSGGNLILAWNTDVATTRKQVLQQERKKLLQISYENESGDVINEQYIGTTFTDTEWVKDSNWEEIPKGKDITSLKNAIWGDLETKITPDKRLEGRYLSTAQNGSFVSHESYNVDVCSVQPRGLIKIIGWVEGSVGAYAFFADVDCQNFVAKGENSTGSLNINKSIIVPEGANYLALSKANWNTLEAFKVETGAINFVNEALEKSQQSLEISQNLEKEVKDELYSDIDTIIEPAETRKGYYFTPSGTLTGGGSNMVYSIDIYDVTPESFYKIQGKAKGIIAVAVAFKDKSLDTPKVLITHNNQSEVGNVDEKIQIPADCNVLAVTFYYLSTNIKSISVFTYEEYARNRIETLENEVFKKKDVICGGDSLTAASYPRHLQSLLGGDYNVINAGVGGESSVTITARLGGLPMLLQDKITFDTNNTPVYIKLVNAYDKVCYPLTQGDGYVNPCFIQGIECTLKAAQTSGTYRLDPKTPPEKSLIVSAKSPLITSAMRIKPYMLSLWMGANRGYDDPEDLANKYQSIVDFYGVYRFIIIGIHTYIELEELKSIEEVLLKRFGAKFINLREYFSTQALYDAGIEPTEDDITAMSEGKCPPSLLKDPIHLTDKGYEILAKFVYQRMRTLSYV